LYLATPEPPALSVAGAHESAGLAVVGVMPVSPVGALGAVASTMTLVVADAVLTLPAPSTAMTL
jgi:hypothetical protein